jgi:hypothetical protein
MQRFFGLLAGAVHRFEATVDKFTDDGIMAVFGAPVAHEDHAQRACYAALAMLEGVGEYAAELGRKDALNFSTRTGINSGEVVAGEIGANGRCAPSSASSCRRQPPRADRHRGRGLHWMDDASEVLLRELVGSVGATKTMVLVNHRPEYQPVWRRALTTARSSWLRSSCTTHACCSTT